MNFPLWTGMCSSNTQRPSYEGQLHKTWHKIINCSRVAVLEWAVHQVLAITFHMKIHSTAGSGPFSLAYCSLLFFFFYSSLPVSSPFRGITRSHTEAAHDDASARDREWKSTLQLSLVNFHFHPGNHMKMQIIITVSRNKKCVGCLNSVTFIRTNAPVTLALQKEQNITILY